MDNDHAEKVYPCGPCETVVPIQAVGLEALLCPFLEKNTGQRSMMFASHIWQSVVTDGVEFPRIATGYEQQFMEYSLNRAKLDHDVLLYEAIPKFVTGGSDIRNNPTVFVIHVRGKVADYVEITNVTKLYNGFGFNNVKTDDYYMLNMGRGALLNKELLFSQPSNHVDMKIQDGDRLYCQGMNANVAYMCIPQAAEDSEIVSESFAKRCQYKAVFTAKIIVPKNKLPLNRYGTPEMPKCFPDIGEKVNDDGILFATRDLNASNFAALVSASTSSVLINDDDYVYAEAGSTVIDVDVQFNPDWFEELQKDPRMLAQPVRYQQQHKKFYERIIRVSEELTRDGYTFSPKLNDLVTTALVLGRRRKKIDIIEGRNSIEGCIITITYESTRQIGPGNKSTGRYGDKGVISNIWPDDWMPVNEFGVRADLIRSGETVGNRSNVGQLYEQHYNRLATYVHMHLCKGTYAGHEFETCIQFMKGVNQKWTEQIIESVCVDEASKTSFVETIKREGFYFIIPPFSKDITMDQVRELTKQVGALKTPVTYKYSSHGVVQTYRTLNNVAIGQIYVYLLGKIPRYQLSAHQMAHVNQVQIPIKTSSTTVKLRYSTIPTPIRFGEDELRMLSNLKDPDKTARFVMVRAGSAYASEETAKQLLTAVHPSDIASLPIATEEMIRRSDTIGLFVAMMGILGFDLSDTSKGRKVMKYDSQSTLGV